MAGKMGWRRLWFGDLLRPANSNQAGSGSVSHTARTAKFIKKRVKIQLCMFLLYYVFKWHRFSLIPQLFCRRIASGYHLFKIPFFIKNHGYRDFMWSFFHFSAPFPEFCWLQLIYRPICFAGQRIYHPPFLLFEKSLKR